jgi:hypothetical protein
LSGFANVFLAIGWKSPFALTLAWGSKYFAGFGGYVVDFVEVVGL